MDSKIKSLKNKIIARDWILQGTLLRQYKQCGKNNCRCHQDQKHWHGPYWIWTRKEKGKTITKTLSDSQATMVKKSLKEMKEINKLVEKWKLLSLRHMENI
ncbi:hypothetical protein MNBD_GAMMA12-2229 [hydrothermal vent metagenome]|uniref:DUF6788 domain-containing protein n=1 Tax=hydrothermal vent metagenome TaxID=652676 RepID=A0A3B0YXS7_9ZZZZ